MIRAHARVCLPISVELSAKNTYLLRVLRQVLFRLLALHGKITHKHTVISLERVLKTMVVKIPFNCLFFAHSFDLKRAN